MRLTVDIRFAPAAPDDAQGDRTLTLENLAGLIRRPAALRRELRSEKWDEVVVERDPLIALSGVQAAGMLIASLARTRRALMRGDGLERAAGIWAFRARAFGAVAVAMPRELIGSVATYLRLRRVLRRSPKPVAAAGASRVTYLRPAPTLRWMGEYVGGAATHTTGVINGFVANGLGVRVFAPERPQGTERAEFTPVPLRRVFQLAQWMTSTAYSRDVADAAESAPADLVYQRYTLGSYAGVELARRLGLPLVLEWNGSEVWTIRHWGSGRLPLADTLVDMERHNLEAAALIVVVSDVLRDQLVDEGVPAERVLVNPNGVDVDALARLRERSAAEWRVVCEQPDVPTIGFIGTFGLWHGVTVLPAMVAAVAKHRPEARWILIGDGRLFDEVRRDLEARGMTNRVFMPGVVPHQRALELLAASDVTVSPHIPNPDGTRFFGSPTKLFEYMGLAKPIVASDLEQIGQVIEHERTGLLCPPGDAEAAAAAVVRLLVDRGLAESLGEAALESARTTYSWEQHVRRILDAL